MVDPTQILIEDMRPKRKSHPFNRVSFWLICCIFILAISFIILAFKLLGPLS